MYNYLHFHPQRARDLFYAMWVPDLFMERVKQDTTWSLMCPHECPGLADTWGDEFKALYEKYEKEGRARKTVNAHQLWFAILQSQTETGTPYMLYKDACNRKSNQKVNCVTNYNPSPPVNIFNLQQFVCVLTCVVTVHYSLRLCSCTYMCIHNYA